MSHPLRREPDVRLPQVGLAGGQDDAAQVYDQPDPKSMHAQFDKLLDQMSDTLPAVTEYLHAARADVLAFTRSPNQIWRQIWSDNPNERLSREIRRRTDVIGILPDRDAITRLAGAVLAERHDEWIEGGVFRLLRYRHFTASTGEAFE